MPSYPDKYKSDEIIYDRRPKSESKSLRPFDPIKNYSILVFLNPKFDNTCIKKFEKEMSVYLKSFLRIESGTKFGIYQSFYYLLFSYSVSSITFRKGKNVIQKFDAYLKLRMKQITNLSLNFEYAMGFIKSGNETLSDIEFESLASETKSLFPAKNFIVYTKACKVFLGL